MHIQNHSRASAQIWPIKPSPKSFLLGTCVADAHGICGSRSVNAKDSDHGRIWWRSACIARRTVAHVVQRCSKAEAVTGCRYGIWDDMGMVSLKCMHETSWDTMIHQLSLMVIHYYTLQYSSCGDQHAFTNNFIILCYSIFASVARVWSVAICSQHLEETLSCACWWLCNSADRATPTGEIGELHRIAVKCWL